MRSTWCFIDFHFFFFFIINSLIIEVRNSVRSGSNLGSMYGHLFKDVFSLVNSFSSSHCYRQGNVVADALVKRARLSFPFLVWMECVSSNVVQFVLADCPAHWLIKFLRYSFSKKKKKETWEIGILDVVIRNNIISRSVLLFNYKTLWLDFHFSDLCAFDACYLILNFSGFIYSFIPSFNLCFLYFDVAFKDERKRCSWILNPTIAFALHNFEVIILKENKCNGNVNVKGRTS